MVIYEGKHPKLVLVFDFIYHKNMKDVDKQSENWDIYSVYSALLGNFPDLEPLEKVNPDDLVIIVLLNNKHYKSKDNTLYRLIDNSLRFDLYSYLIGLSEDIILMPIGKYSLYALTKQKKITSQAGKELQTLITIDLDNNKKAEFRFKTIPNNSLQYVYLNRYILLFFQRIFEEVIAEIYDIDISYNLPETKTILNEDEALSYLGKLIKSDVPYIFFDIETERLHNSEVLGVSIDYDSNDIPVYIPIFSTKIKNKISELLKVKPIIGHNLQFDLRQLVYNGFIKYEDVKVYADTMVMAHLLYNKTLNTLSLKGLAQKLLNAPEWEKDIKTLFKIPIKIQQQTLLKYLSEKDTIEVIRNVSEIIFDIKKWEENYKEILSKYKLKKKDINAILSELKNNKVSLKENYKDIPIDILGKYASLDAYFTKELYNHFKEKWDSDWDYLLNEYNKFLKLTSRWTLKGCKIDIEKLNELDTLISPILNNYVFKMLELLKVKQFNKDKGKIINFNSSDDLNELLIKYFKLSQYKKTNANRIALNKEGIEYILEYYHKYDTKEARDIKEFINLLKEYKELEKAKTSYINKLKKETTQTGMFYADFNIGGTITGRLSSFFHTLPSRGELGKNFKMLVKPRSDDYVIVSSDFGQLEPRTLASLSNDKNLIQAYKEGKDLYRYLASKVFNIEYNEVSSDLRNKMKTFVLAIMYGMGAKTLSYKLGVLEEEAKKIISNFEKEFSGVTEWKEEQYLKVRHTKEVETALKRRIPITKFYENELRRVSVNYPIQSTASEMANISFTDIDTMFKIKKLKSFSIGGVHDSLVIETHITEILDVLDILEQYSKVIMQKKFPFIKVPMVLDSNIGVSWGNTCEITKREGNTLYLEGKSIDFLQLLHKLYKHNINFREKILSKSPIKSSNLSLLSKYDTLYNINAKLTLGG